MVRFIGHRFLQAVPLLFVISILAFLLLHAAPGGPLAVYLSNPNVRPEDIARLSRALGLDRPIWAQYWSWMAAFARGDWGYSFSDGRPVTDWLADRLPATIELVGVALAGATTITFAAGILSAVGRGGWFDRATSALAIAGVSLPAFWFGLLLQIVFSVGLGWLPSSGRTIVGGDLIDHVQHLVLPASVLAVVQAASWSRYLRASMIAALAQPYTMAARARGLPARRVVLRHALRNAVSPLIAMVMMDLALLASGAVVTESVFAWPGLGSLFTESLARRDYSVLMALLMLSSLAIVVFNVVADVLHALVDPRVRAD